MYPTTPKAIQAARCLIPLIFIGSGSFAPSLLLLHKQGTGSPQSFGENQAQEQHSRFQHYPVAQIPSPNISAKKADVRNHCEHLENIRSVFKPAISDLASIFGVTRQCIYKWLSGDSNPESDNLDQIRNLSQVADAFQSANVKRADNLLKMKAFDGGTSLIDIVKTGKDWNEAVKILIEESLAMENAYKASGLADSKAKPTADWQSYISIPNSFEDI